MSLLNGAEKPVVPMPEETLAFPVVLLVAGLLASVVWQIGPNCVTQDFRDDFRSGWKSGRLEDIVRNGGV